MEIILLERIAKLGQMGDIVNVKDGFARNYLLPQKKALRANPQNVKIFESKKAKLEIDSLEQKKEAEIISDKMKDLSVIIIRQASEGGQLYGSVTSRDIAKSISDAGYKINRRQIILNSTIKQVGIYKIKISLHPEIIKNIDVNVARSPEEARIQLSNSLDDKKIDSNNKKTDLKDDKQELSVSEDFFENKELAETAKENMKAEEITESAENQISSNEESN
ncbi:MAG: 50S ribosomal protein L9 [Rhodospirillaceae bacterium]|nr:50S ribosomal protein L9 [Rhodospirillaceae bacterium]